MPEKNQVFIYSDTELELIKNTFAENDELLYLIRNVLLQLPITPSERAQLKAQITPSVYQVLKKRLHPEIDPRLPFGQLGDIYQTLTNDLKTKDVDQMAPLFDAKQLEADYLDQQFLVLRDAEGTAPEPIRLNDLAVLRGKEPYRRYVETTARNFILGYVDPMLLLLKNIAGQKTETLAAAKKRMERDSAK